MELVRSEDTKAKIRVSMSATKARRQTQVCRVFELKVSIRHNPKETFKKLAQCFGEAKWVINDMLSLSKDNPDNSMFDYKYTEYKDVVHYDKDKNPTYSQDSQQAKIVCQSAHTQPPDRTVSLPWQHRQHYKLTAFRRCVVDLNTTPVSVIRTRNTAATRPGTQRSSPRST